VKINRFYLKLNNIWMTYATRDITAMIYLIFVQYMKHKMQITQQRLEYDLMTNSVKFTQQTTSPLLEGDNIVCNSH